MSDFFQTKYKVSTVNQDKYKKIINYVCGLLDEYVTNQIFPEKGIKFLNMLFAQNDVTDLSQEKIVSMFETTFKIPKELIVKHIGLESKFNLMSESISQKIIGQDYQLDEIESGIKEFILHNENHTNPFTAMLLGPTGVGKTESTIQIAQHLNLPYRVFNMAEYQHAVQATQITDDLKQFLKENEMSVITFDEIEKAHPVVFDTLLSLLDRGVVGSGEQTVRKKNHIIFLTSNLLQSELREAQEVMTEEGLSHIPIEYTKAILSRAEIFRPEFIGRLDKVISYSELTESHIVKIVNSICSTASQCQQSSGNLVHFAEGFREFLMQQYNHNRTGGVRGIQNLLTQTMEEVVGNHAALAARQMRDHINGNDTVSNHITIDYKNGHVVSLINGVEIKQKKAVISPDNIFKKIEELRTRRTQSTQFASHSRPCT